MSGGGMIMMGAARHAGRCRNEVARVVEPLSTTEQVVFALFVVVVLVFCVALPLWVNRQQRKRRMKWRERMDLKGNKHG